MTAKIYDVIVNKLSLVSSSETPAVPKAGNSYAIFKTEGRKTKLAKFFGFEKETPGKVSDEINKAIIKLDNIQF